MYVDRIAQVVSWCTEQDIYVIIDYHQDNYGYGVPNGGADGAPLWATPTPAQLNATAADIPVITRDVLQVSQSANCARPRALVSIVLARVH